MNRTKILAVCAGPFIFLMAQAARADLPVHLDCSLLQELSTGTVSLPIQVTLPAVVGAATNGTTVELFTTDIDNLDQLETIPMSDFGSPMAQRYIALRTRDVEGVKGVLLVSRDAPKFDFGVHANGLSHISCTQPSVTKTAPLALGENFACSINRIENGKIVDTIRANLHDSGLSGHIYGPAYYGLFGYNQAGNEVSLELSNTFYTRFTNLSFRSAQQLKNRVRIPSDPTFQLPPLTLEGLCDRTFEPPNVQRLIVGDYFRELPQSGSLAIPIAVDAGGTIKRMAVDISIYRERASNLRVSLITPQGVAYALSGTYTDTSNYTVNDFNPAGVVGTLAAGTWTILIEDLVDGVGGEVSAELQIQTE